MEKKRLIVNIDNLPEGVLDAIQKKYPNGYSDYVFKVSKPNGDFFYGITVDTENASYLVKVKVKIDTIPDNDEKDTGENNDIDNSEEALIDESVELSDDDD